MTDLLQRAAMRLSSGPVDQLDTPIDDEAL